MHISMGYKQHAMSFHWWLSGPKIVDSWCKNCQNSRSIYITRLIVRQPRHAGDTSTNRLQSLFCCCTASMEQAADGAETAAIDRLVSSWTENVSVLSCLWTPGMDDSVMRPRLLVGGTIQVP